ncbi:hypothetical protein HMPREF9145_1144 [Segatella salivae F0493]|uniref:Uncharacterized protein n=1 Tax=Segatella salivae F0493 TaxID=1395125 RepID=U2L1V3_9BACT|nr:hypothetical protein HMPREF9145_1144 [Segatella salivae F0493]
MRIGVVCACIVIAQAKINMDIVLSRFIMKAKVMQKKQKTKVYG